uniref:Uncharacterized protein n=1 Tax=Anopheles farauti TaxID=69004 RepID=A0A182QPU4_9DIPT
MLFAIGCDPRTTVGQGGGWWMMITGWMSSFDGDIRWLHTHRPHFRVPGLQEVRQLLGVLGLLRGAVPTVTLYHLRQSGCRKEHGRRTSSSNAGRTLEMEIRFQLALSSPTLTELPKEIVGSKIPQQAPDHPIRRERETRQMAQPSRGAFGSDSPASIVVVGRDLISIGDEGSPADFDSQHQNDESDFILFN